MPIGYQSRWSRDNYWPAQEIISEVEKLVPLEEVLEASRNSGPARMYGIAGGSGRIGVISAVSNHFCESCNPLPGDIGRQTADLPVSRQGYDCASCRRNPVCRGYQVFRSCQALPWAPQRWERGKWV